MAETLGAHVPALVPPVELHSRGPHAPFSGTRSRCSRETRALPPFAAGLFPPLLSSAREGGGESKTPSERSRQEGGGGAAGFPQHSKSWLLRIGRFQNRPLSRTTPTPLSRCLASKVRHPRPVLVALLTFTVGKAPRAFQRERHPGFSHRRHSDLPLGSHRSAVRHRATHPRGAPEEPAALPHRGAGAHAERHRVPPLGGVSRGLGEEVQPDSLTRSSLSRASRR